MAVAPWDGKSHNANNPDANNPDANNPDANNPDAEVRRWLFGPLGVGQVLYLVLEREREVHVLRSSGWSCRMTDAAAATILGQPVSAARQFPYQVSQACRMPIALFPVSCEYLRLRWRRRYSAAR